MYYVYDMYSIPHKREDLYTIHDVDEVELRECDTIEEVNHYLEDNSDWRPVHDSCGPSTMPVNCYDEDEAKQFILNVENTRVYSERNGF